MVHFRRWFLRALVPMRNHGILGIARRLRHGVKHPSRMPAKSAEQRVAVTENTTIKTLFHNAPRMFLVRAGKRSLECRNHASDEPQIKIQTRPAVPGPVDWLAEIFSGDNRGTRHSCLVPRHTPGLVVRNRPDAGDRGGLFSRFARGFYF